MHHSRFPDQARAATRTSRAKPGPSPATAAPPWPCAITRPAPRCPTRQRGSLTDPRALLLARVFGHGLRHRLPLGIFEPLPVDPDRCRPESVGSVTRPTGRLFESFPVLLCPFLPLYVAAAHGDGLLGDALPGIAPKEVRILLRRPYSAA